MNVLMGGEWQVVDQWQEPGARGCGRAEERWYRWRESPYWLPPNASNSLGRRTISPPSRPLQLSLSLPFTIVLHGRRTAPTNRPAAGGSRSRWIHPRYKGDKETQRNAHVTCRATSNRRILRSARLAGLNLSPCPWHHISARDNRTRLTSY